MTSIAFHEHMGGFVSFDETDPNQAWLAGKRAGTSCSFDLDIVLDDVDRVIDDPEHTGSATGFVACDELGGRLEVRRGIFNLFVASDAARGPRARMRYRLFLTDPDGRALTLSGFKVIDDDPGFDVWSDTTTLFTRILSGHVEEAEEADEERAAALVVATGILRISHLGFLRLLTTVRTAGGSRRTRAQALARFGELFAGELWRVYGHRAGLDGQPDFPAVVDGSEPFRGHPPGEWHDVEHRPGLQRRIIAFQALDGFEGTLHQLRGASEPTKPPVMLVHGTGVRGDLFYGHPGPHSLVEHLVAQGHDVWLENWRGSIDLVPHEYTLDQAAAYDHPAAVRTILRETGHERMKVVVHCQGSTSWSIAAAAGLVPEVDTVVSSAVSMHPVVPRWSRAKLTFLVPALGRLTPYVDAQWAARSSSLVPRAMAFWARTLRRECDDPVCALANYMYGVGPDVLWRHANLDDETHHWTSREFGYAPIRFLKQIGRSVRAGHLVNVDGLRALPADYLAAGPPQGQRWTFIAGTRNRLFLPESQARTFRWFDEAQPGVHQHHVFDGYGHLDLLFGRDAHRDVFPAIDAALA